MVRSIVITGLIGSISLFILGCLIPIVGMFIFSSMNQQSSTFFILAAVELSLISLILYVSFELSRRYHRLCPLWFMSSGFIIGIFGWVGSLGHLMAGGDKIAIFVWAGLLLTVIPLLNLAVLLVGRSQGKGDRDGDVSSLD